MKVLWIINNPIGPISNMLNVKSSSGKWLSASLNEVECNEIELYIVCCINTNDNIIIKENNITYIGIAGNGPSKYVVDSDSIKSWEQIYQDIKPDLVHIWGSEYPHALAALKGKPDKIPALIYVQGVMKSVSDNYFGGIDRKTLSKYTSIIERITKKSIFDSQKRILDSANNEIEIIKRVNGIIYETDWSKEYYSSINKHIPCYYHKLPIDSAFLEFHWSIDKCIPHRIFTPASDYPLKGVHYLIQAVAVLKTSYPDIKLVIPGASVSKDLTIKDRLKQKAYRKYLRKLIFENDLWDNIEFPGYLSSTQMAENMKRANLFVCASTIENHSSTLREAMFVGTPCITTNVGGIPEYFNNKEEGLMYNPTDVDSLVKSITQLFSDKTMCELYSENARKRISDYYGSSSQNLLDIYKEFLASIK